MAPPGILEARYRRLAGDEDRRRELYFARVHLNFTIDEWLALPWWQRRVYLEGANEEAEQRNAAASGGPGGSGGTSGASDPATALLGGTMGDLAGLGFNAG